MWQDIINVVAYSKDGEEEEELKQVRQLMQVRFRSMQSMWARFRNETEFEELF